MEVQLKDYEIIPGHMSDFLTGWRNGVVPLRERVGFRIVGAWVDPEHDRFVWVTSYDGPDDFQTADAVYHALPERRALNPEPAGFVKAKRISFVLPVYVSPTGGLHGSADGG